MKVVYCACQDLRDYLHKGVALDELWKVAKGDIKYADFIQQQQQQQPQDGASQPAQEQLPALPEDLVSLCAAPSACTRGMRLKATQVAGRTIITPLVTQLCTNAVTKVVSRQLGDT